MLRAQGEVELLAGGVFVLVLRTQPREAVHLGCGESYTRSPIPGGSRRYGAAAVVEGATEQRGWLNPVTFWFGLSGTDEIMGVDFAK